MSYVLALDQGTTSSRSIVFDRDGRFVASDQREYRQIFPQSGWVEHDPRELCQSQIASAEAAIRSAGLLPDAIAAMGIANQRESTIIWDRSSGEPIYNSIV